VADVYQHTALVEEDVRQMLGVDVWTDWLKRT